MMPVCSRDVFYGMSATAFSARSIASHEAMRAAAKNAVREDVQSCDHHDESVSEVH
jgi:hypothetical protein